MPTLTLQTSNPIGWGWEGVIWLYSLVSYFPLDIFKFVVLYVMSGKYWGNLIEHNVFISLHSILVLYGII